jgi:hypothetical protein
MLDYLLTIQALDETGTPKTLRFSQGGYIDVSGNLYNPRLNKSVLVRVSPNDGGVLSIMGAASVGDVELDNVDGGLNYLIEYGIDGGAVEVSYFDGTTVITRFVGVAGKPVADGDAFIINLKAHHEAFKKDFTLAIYAGDNALPDGLEGTEDTIKGKSKPQLFGDCRNVSPINVNTPLQIYQAADNDNVVITKVYVNGVRWVNYRASSPHSVGVSVINLAFGLGDIPTGSKVMFDGHYKVYDVTTGLSGGTITISPALVAAVPLKAACEVINFYNSEADLKGTNYFLDGDHDAGVSVIEVTGGVGDIAIGDRVSFGADSHIYTVSVALSAGSFTISRGLLTELQDGDIVQIIGDAYPVLWGAYNGYLRLAYQATGVVTCDAISVDGSGNVQKAGAVFAAIADTAGYTADPAIFDAVGTIGLYIDRLTPVQDLLNRIAASVAGYYWYDLGEIITALYASPAVTAAYTIEDWQIKSIKADAHGLGANGLPIHTINAKYDRVETVQDSIAPVAPARHRARVKTQTRDLSLSDTAVLAQHRLSLPLAVDSLLRNRGEASTAFNRLFALVKARRDLVKLVMDLEEVPSFQFGATFEVVTNMQDYEAGRNLVLYAYEIDDDAHLATLTLAG